MTSSDEHATFVVPTFNRAPFIAECLLSIQAQTANDWSIIVVDDGSTDGTRDLVASLAVPNLLYLANAQRMGASESRNRAIEAARGGLVVFIDSDDRLHSSYLGSVRGLLSNQPDVGAACCDSRIIDEKGDVLQGGTSFQALEMRRKGYSLRQGKRSFEDVFVFSTSFPGTAVRHDVLSRLGGFNQQTFPLDDVDLQLRLCAAGVGVYYLDKILADYRSHGGSESAGRNRAMNTCQKKVACLSAWRSKAPPATPRRPLRRRLADAHVELAIASWKAGEWAKARRSLGAALIGSPAVVVAFARRYLLMRRR